MCGAGDGGWPDGFRRRRRAVLVPGETLPAAIRIADIQNVYGFEYGAQVRSIFVQVIDSDPNAPGVQLLPGDFLSSDLIVRNSADNAAGAIQYAVTQLNPSAVPKSGSGTLFTLNIVGGAACKPRAASR